MLLGDVPWQHLGSSPYPASHCNRNTALLDKPSWLQPLTFWLRSPSMPSPVAFWNPVVQKEQFAQRGSWGLESTVHFATIRGTLHLHAPLCCSEPQSNPPAAHIALTANLTPQNRPNQPHFSELSPFFQLTSSHSCQ